MTRGPVPVVAGLGDLPDGVVQTPYHGKGPLPGSLESTMPNTFLISDTHFGQEGICQFLNWDGSKVRPWDTAAEMDEAMVERWNATVGPGDKVYHLGDVAIARKSLAIMARLNGKKVLIRGNHDIFKLNDYLPHFYDIRGSHKLGNLILSHIPVHPDAITNRWCQGNVHGHTHANLVMAGDQPDPRYFNVCAERIHYTPMALDDLLLRVAAGNSR
jgi:calcineurin-like phosphoesterase family protein